MEKRTAFNATRLRLRTSDRQPLRELALADRRVSNINGWRRSALTFRPFRFICPRASKHGDRVLNLQSQGL
jgi:hypothetical protein